MLVALVFLILTSSGVEAKESPEPKPLPTMEESVLVAERQATADPKEQLQSFDQDQLEPIAQITDYAPDLAESLSVVKDPITRETKKPIASPGDEVEEKPRAPTAVANSLQSVSTRFLVNPSSEQPLESSGEFSGIQPGVSTAEDVLGRWGEPLRHRRTEDGLILTFRVEPYPLVDVLIQNDVVEAMKVELTKPADPRKLAKKLRLDEIDPVDINEDDGQTIGIAFPERGTVFMLDQSSEENDAKQRLVSYIIMERLDPEAFVLRAEQRLHGPYQQNVADLKQAIALDGEFAHAYRLLAEIYLATGKPTLAEEAIEQAQELDPENDAYRMFLVRCWEAQAEYDEAVYATRSILDKKDVPPLVKAEAFHRLGCLASLGDKSIASKAIPFQNDAIALADKLAASKNIKQRRAAIELLIDAHLAIARDIARQDYRNKSKAIGHWLSRASGLAEDCIAQDGGSLELRLRVAKQGLAAVADLRPPKDPHPWVIEAEETIVTLKDQWDDERWQERLAWEMGQIYYHALRIEHVRRQTPSAIRFGRQAIDNLAEGARSRQAAPPSEELVGSLYFHVGVVHAVHNEDHGKAIAWYDKAAPLLMSEKPVSDLTVPRQEGEALVSMGVSYWQEGKASRALDLTHAGTKLIEESIEGGIASKDTLNVPYTNLATMYQELGNTDEALKYSRRAKPGGTLPVAASRTDVSQSDRTTTTRTPARTTSSSRARLQSAAEPRARNRQQEARSTSPASRGRVNKSNRRVSQAGPIDFGNDLARSGVQRRRITPAIPLAPSIPSIELAAPNFHATRPITRTSATYVR